MLTFFRKYFSPFVHQHEDLGITQIFKPLYVLVSILGLFPRSIKIPNGKSNLNVSFNSLTINLALTLIVPVVICVFYALHIVELKVTDARNIITGDKFTQTNYNIQLATQFIVSTIVFVSAFKYQSTYIKVLNEIVECWADLPNATKGSNVILGRLRVKVNCGVLGSLLVVLIVQFAVTYTENVTAWKNLLQFLTFVLPELVQFTLVAFFFVMVLMVVALLKNIEEHFRILVHIRRIRSTRYDYVGVEPGPLPTSLRQLRSVYARALSVKRQVNAAFQAPLLLVLAQSFHTLVSNTHTLCQGFIFQKSFNYHDMIECSSWICYQIIKFYTIGKSGALLKLQANAIGRALYDIPTGSNGDVALHLEIQHFSTLMSFYLTEINLYGFFPLEASLVFNTLASAATYSVILVQFDNTA